MNEYELVGRAMPAVVQGMMNGYFGPPVSHMETTVYTSRAGLHAIVTKSPSGDFKILLRETTLKADRKTLDDAVASLKKELGFSVVKKYDADSKPTSSKTTFSGTA